MRKLILVTLLMLSPVVASAQTVGPTCTLFWNVPTTNADNVTPLATPIGSYRVYLTTTPTPVPVPGTTVPTAIVSNGAGVPANNWNCAGIAVGQHYAWVTAVNANGESAVQPSPLAFVYSSTSPTPQPTPPPPPPPPLPGTPTGVRVQ